MSHVLYMGSSALDQLLQGLLTVDVAKRFNADQALLKAIAWAKAEGLANEAIADTVTTNIAGKRAEFPPSWHACPKANCGKSRCFQVSTSPLKAQCGSNKLNQSIKEKAEAQNLGLKLPEIKSPKQDFNLKKDFQIQPNKIRPTL